MTISQTQYDTIIAGAGPVGLFLACELSLAGCSVLVLEQASDPSSPLKRAPFGLRGLSVPTIESLDRRGLLNEIEAYAATRATLGTAHWMKQLRRPGGHFAGIQFFHDRIDTGRWTHRLPSQISNLAAEMAGIEAVLTARAEASGVTVLRGGGVESFTQTDEAVVVQAGGRSFRGRWLVGCDGARSAVRQAAGISFTGTEPEFTGYSVQAELAGADALKPGRQYTAQGMYLFTPPGTVAMADFDGGAFHRSAPITREHVEAVLRRISGTDVTVTKLELATSWTDRAFQASAYRNGRVLLAGDAAHIHSPLGGQGLNLGLGDAMNLGWKLAATIRGDAPAGLLNSYERERHPVGARVLDWSRAQVTLMRPSPGSRALEAIIRDLIETQDGATYFAERVWGVSLRYDLGGNHPLVGYSVPNLVLKDGRCVGSLLRDGKGLLLDFDPGASHQAFACRQSKKISYAATDARDQLGLQTVLVRPDGIIAWASETAADEATISQAMSPWFGD
ncbi:FAD-dependent monooxygenase [Methylobacterium pseudosasicola]|uniref:Pentachlorophenol monooxygenase n=1 Tax=Methylobacterium pseudosasicola TaxID=582667 RepID=A0A1I4N5L8_9HYPH|nr:FAD-dependent monooxygenase [Methylobacterium pseudosasicola]SFM10616.1 pentachlorophenol monooxygenase [Methylobacterium pseudosasicola]